MRTRVFRWLAPVLFLVVSPTIGQAGTINITAGTLGTIPAGAGANNFIGAGEIFAGAIGGFYGSNVDVNVAGPSIVTIDFFGGEADFSNQFSLGATQLFDHAPGTLISHSAAIPLSSFSAPLLGLGLLAFHFDVHGHLAQVIDGSNPDDSAHNTHLPNFFVSCNPFGGAQTTTCDRLWVFLDDSGGGPDDDYDDMVLRISIATVPEPVTLALLGLGLMGGSLLARKRQ